MASLLPRFQAVVLSVFVAEAMPRSLSLAPSASPCCLGISSQLRPSSFRPAAALETPPHCLKRTEPDSLSSDREFVEPSGLHRSRAGPRLTPDDHPMDSAKWQPTNRPEERFERKEPNIRGNASQVSDSANVGRTLHRRAHPNVVGPREPGRQFRRAWAVSSKSEMCAVKRVALRKSNPR